MTPEQMETSIKLQEIFMPHANAKRFWFYEGRDNARFVHYTSAEAAINIIKSKRIWMRNTTCMSDYSEVLHGFKLLNSYFLNEVNKNEFINTLESCSPKIGLDAINLFNQWWNDIQINTYITAISEHDPTEDQNGRLSMWRAFGGKIARVAIVFNIPWNAPEVSILNVMFSPVAYLKEEEVIKEIQTVISKVKSNIEFLRSVDRSLLLATIFNMLVAGVTCLKHEGFREEREWRALYLPNIYKSPLLERARETVNCIPQIVYKLPLDVNVSQNLAALDLPKILERIIIGPFPFPLAQYEAFVDVLKNAGISNAERKVIALEIPIRI